MITVTLDKNEMWIAGLVGYLRNCEAIYKNRKPRFPEKVSGELFGFHIIGAMAEVAVAKYTNKYWAMHVNKFSGGDVGSMEVRYSEMDKLKVRERDEGIVVSVSGKPPTFIMNGWMQAEDAKKDIWKKAYRDGPPAYFVPHEMLRSIATLRGHIDDKNKGAG